MERHPFELALVLEKAHSICASPWLWQGCGAGCGGGKLHRGMHRLKYKWLRSWPQKLYRCSLHALDGRYGDGEEANINPSKRN